MMFVSLESSKAGATSVTRTVFPFRGHVFMVLVGFVPVAQSLIFAVVVCRLVFILSCFF